MGVPDGNRGSKHAAKRVRKTQAQRTPQNNSHIKHKKRSCGITRNDTVNKSDGDTLGVEGRDLRPIDRYILGKGKSLDRPFCWEHFKDKYRHGSIRNAFSRLRNYGLIELYSRSGVAFHTIPRKGKSSPRKKVTLHHMGGEGPPRVVRVDLAAFLESVEWSRVSAVHDLRLSFVSTGLYQLFFGAINHLSEYSVLPRSKDIHSVSPFVWSSRLRREAKVTLHRTGTVTVAVSCSDVPIEISLESLSELSAFFGEVRGHLMDVVHRLHESNHFIGEISVPNVPLWSVRSWHYGRDGREISGSAFNVTFRTWNGEYARLYMKRVGAGELKKPRMEKIEKPKKPFVQAFHEKLDPISVLRVEMRAVREATLGFSENMRSHIEVLKGIGDNVSKETKAINRQTVVLSQLERLIERLERWAKARDKESGLEAPFAERRD